VRAVLPTIEQPKEHVAVAIDYFGWGVGGDVRSALALRCESEQTDTNEQGASGLGHWGGSDIAEAAPRRGAHTPVREGDVDVDVVTDQV
jgi:hypothetical protein